MAKKVIKVYLEEKSVKNLKKKAEELGYIGRGAVSRYIEKVASEPVIFLDNNLKELTRLFQMVPK